MSRKILISALIAMGMLSNAAMAENWQEVGRNEMMTVYLDTDSIQHIGIMTYVRTKVVPEVKTEFTHGINREAYNCKGKMSTIRSMTSFKGKKIVDYIESKKLEWDPVQMDGISGLVYKRICNQK